MIAAIVCGALGLLLVGLLLLRDYRFWANQVTLNGEVRVLRAEVASLREEVKASKVTTGLFERMVPVNEEEDPGNRATVVMRAGDSGPRAIGTDEDRPTDSDGLTRVWAAKAGGAR
jgi:hypothetical protein